MEGECLKYGGEVMRDEIWKIANMVWDREGLPDEWKCGLIVPIVKK